MSTDAATEPITFPSEIPVMQHRDLSRGLCRVVEQLPFPVSRVFALSSVPFGAVRGGHAHKTCWQAVWAISGGVTLTLEAVDQRFQTKFYRLDQLSDVVVIPPLTWIELTRWTGDGVALVMCSEPYDANEIISREKP